MTVNITVNDKSGKEIAQWQRDNQGNLIEPITRKCVTQPWLDNISMMQQTVLLTAIRGPDGVRKDHPVKTVLRWYRRCILYSAMDHRILTSHMELGGGSFTGPFTNDGRDFNKLTLVTFFKDSIDELPHHFQMHLMHGAEILGYKHPDENTKGYWNRFYENYVKALHLSPESEQDLDRRLGDNEESWKASEVK